MDFDPENYSDHTLRRFAVFADLICLVVVIVITIGICMIIKWWIA
ncbi:TPA: hypothetical protein ACHP1R_005380 [Raoultella ornithinolytica]